MKAYLALFGIAAAALLGGCGSKTECSVLFEVVDPRLSEISKLQSTPASFEQLRDTALVYRKLIADLDATKLSGGSSNLVAKYRSTAIDLAKGFEGLSAAVEAGDDAQAKSAKNSIEKAGLDERKILDDIGRICRY